MPLLKKGNTIMSEDVKAMVYQWVWRQSLGPVNAFDFLHELKQLLKRWAKDCCNAIPPQFFGSKQPKLTKCWRFAGIGMKRHGRLSSVDLVWLFSYVQRVTDINMGIRPLSAIYSIAVIIHDDRLLLLLLYIIIIVIIIIVGCPSFFWFEKNGWGCDGSGPTWPL